MIEWSDPKMKDWFKLKHVEGHSDLEVLNFRFEHLLDNCAYLNEQINLLRNEIKQLKEIK